MDHEFILFDRLEVIKKTLEQYGEENFYLSFSGGKDSTVVHYLLDMALPGNRIPRVFINTGIEYNAIVNFVEKMAEKDDRVVIIKPQKALKETLEKYGYPFKSKGHAKKVDQYQRRHHLTESLKKYVEGINKPTKFSCPDILKYQFTPECTLKISHLCCDQLKKGPAKKYAKANGKSSCITGMRAEEGGTRAQKHVGCILTDKNGHLKKFNPLIKVTGEWEEWFIQTKQIKLCELYYEPFNFKRTGCKGCPFALTLQEQLETMEKYLPGERKQCEFIWKPVYDEYRRIGYRLKKEEQLKLF